jgi:hypothetical protein
MKSLTTNTLGQSLFHPFITVAGGLALGLGLVSNLLTSWIGSFAGAHFDGVLDTHVGARTPLWVFVGEGLIDWLSLALMLLLAGRVMSKTQFRTVDLVGTQALARGPMLLVSLMCLAPGFQRYTQALVKSLTSMAKHPNEPVFPALNADTVVFILVTLGMLACLVWMVALMWKSFSHSCNLRGGRAIAAFIVGLLLAEVISKVAITQMIQHI